MNNFFKTLALTTLAAVATATPAMARSSHQAHVALSRAVEATGISVYVNDPYCDEVKALGLYSAGAKAILICQENRIPGSTRPWLGLRRTMTPSVTRPITWFRIVATAFWTPSWLQSTSVRSNSVTSGSARTAPTGSLPSTLRMELPLTFR